LPGKVRASLTGVTVSCGVISFDVDLVPATRAKADKRAANSPSLTRVCPSCEDPVRIKQVLRCESGHGPLSQNDLQYATTVDDVLVKVDPDEVATASVPTVEARSVAFSVFRAVDVEQATLPSGNVYRMRLPAKPSKATLQAYALMRDLVADTDLAFLAELVIKGVSKLYRGIARDGMITLTELYRPSLFHAPDGADVETNGSMTVAARAMVAEMVATFDPSEWESAAERRLQALQAAAEAGEDVEEPTMVPPATVAAEDLLALLRSAA
jgi:non-homologous end joining protein Ku